ncbi:unnamed protein product [Effrenium voratum]|uniref:Uncharacterized protein n=1 Tax=Effrenium voratum TaxID=2562239 RepID=A0AA36J5Z0_9DINO|nr:unnamed protein product [Effrenium voratum]CAJ1399091.1 unnamed protein product [Effrenium voratum]CAJ1432213.1 unnamed protein product [Effrenium voratum]
MRETEQWQQRRRLRATGRSRLSKRASSHARRCHSQGHPLQNVRQDLHQQAQPGPGRPDEAAQDLPRVLAGWWGGRLRRLGLGPLSEVFSASSRLTVPRSFVEISGNQPIEWLEMNLGPKEVLFREAGARLEAAALEAAAQEAQLACDGPEKRRNAEQKLRENRNSQGEPWRHCRGGGRRGAPRHLASRRNRASGAGACGLFSDVPSLEASESAARAGARPRRPASAASVQR